jgi:hypothetical protein
MEENIFESIVAFITFLIILMFFFVVLALFFYQKLIYQETIFLETRVRRYKNRYPVNFPKSGLKVGRGDIKIIFDDNSPKNRGVLKIDSFLYYSQTINNVEIPFFIEKGGQVAYTFPEILSDLPPISIKLSERTNEKLVLKCSLINFEFESY